MRTLAAVLLTAVLTLAPQVASAATLKAQGTTSGTTLELDDPDNAANEVSASYTGGAVTIRDRAVALALTDSGSRCTRVDEFAVRCPFEGWSFLFLRLGGGDDTGVLDASFSSMSSIVVLDGGAGNDRLTSASAAAGAGGVYGGPGNDVLTGGDTIAALYGSTSPQIDEHGETLHGQDGDDVLLGRAGNDALDGGGGNDVIDGGPGRDTIRGGDGDDTLAGDALQTAVGDAVVPGQIFVPEADRVFGDGGNDVIHGGIGHDTLEGGDGRDRLAGGPDNDVLRGDAGADDIDGGEGDDATDYGNRMQGVRVTVDAVADDGEPGEGDLVRASVEAIYGSRHDDVLIGDDGRNQLSGGLGQDRLIGRGGAHDSLLGGEGIDIIDARDNGVAARASVAISPADLPGIDDSIGCLSGRDTVDLDHDDRISDPQNCGTVRRAVPALRASSTGIVRFTLGCASACTNRLRLFDGRELLAHATRKLGRASHTTMRLRLSSDARRRLRQRPSLRATLRIATTVGAKSRTRAVRVILRRAR